jgi:hypothetical protein
LGRANAAIPDTQTEPSQTVNFDDLFIFAGDGGFGMAAGGRGGAITGVISEFGGGDVEISAGWGGNSAAGAAGAGGDVSLQPSPNLNKLRGDLALTAGGGGDGLTGGAGGSIRNFINSPTTSFNPSSLSAFAGDGGSGVTGNGGAGGSISGFNVATANTAGGIALVMAGRGGFSSAGVGGVGGGFSSLTVTSEAGAVVAVAGAGGDGLRGGGTGGSLSSSRINSGGLDNARVVVVAGKGGNAHGVTAATIAAENSLPAYSSLYRSALFTLGTANGLGGTGGSISNFTQPQALQTSVDIIAGNGGDTINYGKILGASGVGRGGSITNVNLANDAGKIAPNTAIRAYAEDFAEQLRDGSITEITDDTGNVGVVVGAAGRVRNDLPSSTGVAGSVDRIAAITSISGLQLQNGGTQIGVAKNGYLDPNLNDGTVYTFNPANPVARPFATTYYAAPNGSGAYLFAPGAVQGGALVDGAILTKSYSGPASSRVFVVN